VCVPLKIYFGSVGKIMLLLCLLFAGYSAAVYVYADGKSNVAPPDEQVTNGWNLWQEKNCQSCHQLYGLGGYAGPDLTNAATDKGVAYMGAVIRSGTDRMPNLQLSEKETSELVAFLKWVDSSGRSKVSLNAIHWTGSYIIDDK